MKTKLIEQRIVKKISCGRERKFAGDPERMRCHLGLAEIHEAVCPSCIWFDQEKVNNGDGRPLVTDREITPDEADALRAEYKTSNAAKKPIPLFDPQSPFMLVYKRPLDV